MYYNASSRKRSSSSSSTPARPPPAALALLDSLPDDLLELGIHSSAVPLVPSNDDALLAYVGSLNPALLAARNALEATLKGALALLVRRLTIAARLRH